MEKRTATIDRNTKETQISLQLVLDGTGEYCIDTKVPFLNHMLELFTRHGLFDMKAQAMGDTEVDDHHTVEDLGICLGLAFAKAVGDKKGIRRYGFMILPMDEALAEVALDFSGRPFLSWNVPWQQEQIKTFQVSLVEEFFRAFCVNAGLNLHVNVRSGKDAHHVAEAVFKATARALREALEIDPRQPGIPSTKGTL